MSEAKTLDENTNKKDKIRFFNFIVSFLIDSKNKEKYSYYNLYTNSFLCIQKNPRTSSGINTLKIYNKLSFHIIIMNSNHFINNYR